MMTRQDDHVPVLFGETLEWLDLRPGLSVVDGTLGGCGHARAILERIMPGGTFIGIDKDMAAIKRARERLADCAGDIRLVHSDFKDIGEILKEQELPSVDRALLDLGVSSFQLEQADRGFSYMQDAPLDMRMDQSASLDARRVVNEYPEAELARILREYGEEKWAARIARFVADERAREPIETTGQLERVIRAAIPAAARRTGPHPAKRTFQAIRIEVNGELAGLAECLEQYVQHLSVDGRLAVITFHSLEDRIVKKELARLADPCTCPPDFPVCVCGRKPTARVLTRKPVVPGPAELADNPRARSAKLRVALRI